MSIWNRIKEWWYDARDRNDYLASFNSDFKQAYRLGQFPVLLKASICSGHPDYASSFSYRAIGFSRSGIKIDALGTNNFFMNVHMANMLALVILSNDRMCRDLLSLGFDTLWVGQFSWKLQNFSLPPSSI
jgi:hypothetical protein